MSKGKKKRTALGNRLRTLRRYNGMTQREVAARLHLERSSYAYYEIGRMIVEEEQLGQNRAA